MMCFLNADKSDADFKQDMNHPKRKTEDIL